MTIKWEPADEAELARRRPPKPVKAVKPPRKPAPKKGDE
jgi:hypothetical protein